jgi:Mlc titration factor MtfA (ptsG expression regulator)
LIILYLLFAGVAAFFFFVVYSVIEEKYGVLFNKPFYIHFYPTVKTLDANQSYVLNKQFDYYNSLSDKKKKYFEHRVATFIERYEFIGKENFIITDEVQVLIASTSVMLTFGLRNYLYTNIDKVIVYPSVYYSETNDTYHKGEFNPRMKAIVFSWEDFKTGYEIKNDNLNLGIHEFAHVLHLHGMNSQDTSAIIFSRMYDRIRREIEYPDNRERLVNSDYFRIYAYTNHFEFLAVIIEHYFESPHLFRQEFPKLYENVSKMLNHKH